ncbi:hypothetical protein B7463_g12547, partial [Scytalidium lignicola]
MQPPGERGQNSSLVRRNSSNHADTNVDANATENGNISANGNEGESIPPGSAKSPGRGVIHIFRHGSSAKYDSNFAKDQPWVKISGRICSEFVDETPELEEIYQKVSNGQTCPVSYSSGSLYYLGRTTTTARSIDHRVSVNQDHDTSQWSPPTATISTEGPVFTTDSNIWSAGSVHVSTQLGSPDTPRSRSGHASEATSFHSPNSFESTHDTTRTFDSSIHTPNENSIASLLRAADLSDIHGFQPHHSITSSLNSGNTQGVAGPSIPKCWPHLNVQEACLTRYFIDNLACWFDLCDPECHFSLIIPQRALQCPALLYAIYTASARHLCRLDQYRNGNNVEYLGKCLPDLKMETAVEYHSRCIECLVEMSNNEEAVYDENLLAASILLRFYDEVDEPLGEGNWETGLKGTKVFLDAQAELSIHDTGLRRAAFRIAYRQEVIVVHCADVLMYCYGEHRYNNDDYDALVEYQRAWQQLRPHSFDPIYDKPANPSLGEIYPELWFLSNCHVTGVQHYDLARILLTVFNPRIPRFGPAHREAVRRVELEIMDIVKRVCGVAISNRRVPPAMNSACIAIAMCGEQFSDIREREAILDILNYTETQHAWPTSEIQNRLKTLWEWYS